MLGVEKEVKYADRETGELLFSAKQFVPNYIDPKRGYRMKARTDNVRHFPAFPIPDCISRLDQGHLFHLSHSMWADTGVLGTLYKRSFKPFDDNGVIDCVGFDNERRGREWLHKMEQANMLRSCDVNIPGGNKERLWFMNPVYFCPMFISRNMYLIWRVELEKHLPGHVKKMFK
jgi:hypothetical protein